MSLLPLGGMVNTFLWILIFSEFLLQINFELYGQEGPLCSLIFKYLLYANTFFFFLQEQSAGLSETLPFSVKAPMGILV